MGTGVLGPLNRCHGIYPRLGTCWLLGVMVSLSALAQPGTLDTTFDPGSGANGEIMTVGVQSDGKLIIGGAFTSYNGTNITRLARLNEDGSLDTTFSPGVYSAAPISNVFVLADDKLVVEYVNGTGRVSIARLNADGSLDPSFIVIVSSPPFRDSAIAIQSDGKVVGVSTLSGGNFVGFWRVNSDGTGDPTFNGYSLLAQGGSISVYAVNGARANDDKILSGGDFFARFLSNGSVDTTSVASSANRGVLAFGFQNDGKILIAGSFTNFGGTARYRVARLNADGNVDATFDPGAGPDSAPKALSLLPDGRVLVAGGFVSFNGTNRQGIARLNQDGSVDATFDPGTGPNAPIDAVAVTKDGEIVIAGQFTSVNGTNRGRIARLNGDAPSDPPSFSNSPATQTALGGRSPFFFANVSGSTPLNYRWKFAGTNLPGATNAVLRLPNVALAAAGNYSVEVTNSHGSITSTDAVLTVRRAPVQAGSPDAAVFTNSGADSVVRAITVRTNGKVIIAGSFLHVNGVNRSRIAQLNPDGSLDLGFDPGAGANDVVYAVALQPDGKVIIGGAFTNVGGLVRRCVARLNTDGSLDSSFNTNSGVQQLSKAVVYAVALQNDGKVIVGGDFDTVNGTTRYSVARLWPDGSTDTSFNLNLSSSAIISSLLIQNDGKLVLGPQEGAYLSRYHTNGALDFTSSIFFVYSLAQQPDGKILAGGAFKYGIVRLNTNGVTDTNFNFGWQPVFRTVHSIAAQAADGRILVGGSFISFNGFGCRCILRLNNNGSVDTTFDTGAGPDGTVLAVAALADCASLIGGEFTSVDGCERHGIARLNGDLKILSEGKTSSVFTATVPTDVGKNYVLEAKDSLEGGAWSSLSTNEGDGTIENLTDATATSQCRFYRVRVE